MRTGAGKTAIVLVAMLVGCGSGGPAAPPSPEQAGNDFLAALKVTNLVDLQNLMASHALRKELDDRASLEADATAALRRFFFGTPEARLEDATIIAIDQHSAGDRLVEVTFEYRLELPGRLVDDEYRGQATFQLSYVRNRWWVSRLPAPLGP